MLPVSKFQSSQTNQKYFTQVRKAKAKSEQTQAHTAHHTPVHTEARRHTK
jgi:hypothetical protein